MKVYLLILLFGVFASFRETCGLSDFLDIEFYKINGYDEAKCGHKTEWDFVNYESIGVDKPSEHSVSGISALSESCISSYPLYLVHNSTLEMTVYIKGTGKSAVKILLLEEFDEVLVYNYTYNQFAAEFKRGWNNVSIPIETDMSVYINLFGYCDGNDKVLIDSIKYVPSISEIKDYKKVKSSPIQTKFEFRGIEVNDDDIVLEEASGELDDEEGSGSYSGDGEIAPTESPIIGTEPEETFWTPLTISAVGVGSVGALAGVGLVAYMIGKKSLIATSATEASVYIEPPPVRMIPRVRSVYSGSDYSQFR